MHQTKRKKKKEEKVHSAHTSTPTGEHACMHDPKCFHIIEQVLAAMSRDCSKTILPMTDINDSFSSSSSAVSSTDSPACWLEDSCKHGRFVLKVCFAVIEIRVDGSYKL